VLKPKPSTLQVPTSLFGADGPAGDERIKRQAARLTAALAASPAEAWPSLLAAVETRELASPIPEILRGPPASACFVLDLASVFVSLVRMPKPEGHDDDADDAEANNNERRRQRDEKTRLFKTMPWGRLGLIWRMRNWTHEPRWFLAELNDACRCTDFDAMLFRDDRGTTRTYFERTAVLCSEEAQVWLGREAKDTQDIAKLTSLVLNASSADIAEALVAQLRVSAESVRLGQGNEAISASQIRAHVMTLEAGALDAVRLAGWGELRRVLHAIRKGATS
jgi:hypothetical protein